MNGLFLIVKATVTASQIVDGLAALLEQGLTIGTDHAVVIVMRVKRMAGLQASFVD